MYDHDNVNLPQAGWTRRDGAWRRVDVIATAPGGARDGYLVRRPDGSRWFTSAANVRFGTRRPRA